MNTEPMILDPADRAARERASELASGMTGYTVFEDTPPEVQPQAKASTKTISKKAAPKKAASKR